MVFALVAVLVVAVVFMLVVSALAAAFPALFVRTTKVWNHH